MELIVNGTGRTLPEGVTVAEVVRTVTDRERGLAVAVNGEVVPRGGWSASVLRDGDRVEVLSATQGG
ncbi:MULTISPECIES: sulfur carrier protein ThiS [Micromonospora]|uniref:Sulfur carrier protein ThiS n=4 Tax=Micromonospora TaxID=1873 RepID=A0A1C4U971_9ACTN|nr:MULTISPECIES: sulfur carrier protein ThiS [Micromonospora]MBF5031542.1 sulfur carrier protein ThiS [Micromonospora sp. ANENR4]ADL48992.1 thiamine biosynthesis protein ThiS [Micromonospora aurantiaca ATCC 27029]AYF31616.1 thiamine biosynthesis protein ThiS [Micromonospora tulbaghiae]MBC8989138.1 sulfur carrier protein ThiS [Micromonospora chalcea]MBP1785662.1 sulfur carrier protein [Micromonospora sp. HB375]